MNDIISTVILVKKKKKVCDITCSVSANIGLTNFHILVFGERKVNVKECAF